MFQVTTMNMDNPVRKDDGTHNYLDDFFSRKAHLTVSVQLQTEDFIKYLIVHVLDKGPEEYSWNLDLHRFGSVPHAGFGLGFERLNSMLQECKIYVL